MNKNVARNFSALSKPFCQTSSTKSFQVFKINYKTNLVPSSFVLSNRASVATSNEHSNNRISDLSKRLQNVYKVYEQFIGLTDVQNAQRQVKQCEKRFLQARGEERRVVREVLMIRDQLKHVRERLSHVNYSNPLYPQLANEQHELVTKEEGMKLTLENAEEKERDTFQHLSAAMRDSYEKERTRVERTKNWSLIGSIIGTVLGMIGGSYINRVRTNDLRQMILDHDHGSEIQQDIAQVMPFVQERYEDVKDTIAQLESCLIRNLMDSPVEGKEKANSNSMVFRQLDVQLKELKALCHSIDVRIQNQPSSFSGGTANNAVSDLSEKFERIERILLEKSKIVAPSKTFEEKVSKEVLKSEDQSSKVKDIASGLSKPFSVAVIWGVVMTAMYYIISV